VDISVIIHTFNEEANLPYALRSVQDWASEILIVDMGSTDKTLEIAQSFGVRILNYPAVGYVEPARAFAVEQARFSWVFILDADELLPKPLAKQLLEIADNDLADVVLIPRFNYMIGAPIQGAGWGPEQDTHPRFFKKGSISFSPKIHVVPKILDNQRVLRLPYQEGVAIIHFNYLDFEQFIGKLNHYTTIHAQERQNSNDAPQTGRTLFKALARWLYRYIYLKGYRDGWRGFYLSCFMIFYDLAIEAKLIQVRESGDRKTIMSYYRDEAERWLKE
jgi:glycosyltransferase involved in cell wall biosynthesis